MKNVVVLCVSLLMVLNSFGQTLNIPGTNYPFNSDIITYVVTDSFSYDIVPLNNDSLTVQGPLDEDKFNQIVVTSVNKFRNEYGLGDLVLNKTICDELKNSILYGDVLNGFPWSIYSLFNTYGYVSHFENKEEKFCDYLLDLMSLGIGSGLNGEIMKPESKEFGYYFRQKEEDESVDFIIYIK